VNERAERVVEWAHLHGDDLAHVLRLDSEFDEGTLNTIQDALGCTHDLLGTLQRIERLEAIAEAARKVFEFYADESLHELEDDEPNGRAHARAILGDELIDALTSWDRP
jgi:hypothetical protein